MLFRSRADAEPVIAIYIDAMKRAFIDSEWREIEPLAHRAWSRSSIDGEPAWMQIRNRMKREWPSAIGEKIQTSDS